MRKLLEKLKTIESKIASIHGEFTFFGLLQRKESSQKWDLVVSADWIHDDKYKSLQIISKEIQETLNKSEFLSISHIAVIEFDSESLDNLILTPKNFDGIIEINNTIFLGQEIEHGFILKAKDLFTEAEMV